MNTPPEIAARLRQIRRQQNLTLKQVEIKSRGQWKAVVVGSYERGSRTLSVLKAQQLCEFYGIPISQLFIETNTKSQPSPDFLWRIDLRKLRGLQSNPDQFSHLIFNFLQQIVAKRDDWNGEVLTIRRSDHEILTLITTKEISELRQALIIRELLLKS